uniref:VWFA domain-containing protein n=1 Tax=Romanomermis culicivorax TaxID=13658 RepID=A0A915K2X3_ROMCU
MDLLFLVDNSSSMTVRSFEKAKKFMKTLVHHVDVGLTKSRVGLVVFNQEPSLVFGMDKYLSSEFVKSELEKTFVIAVVRVQKMSSREKLAVKLDLYK